MCVAQVEGREKEGLRLSAIPLEWGTQREEAEDRRGIQGKIREAFRKNPKDRDT